MARFMFFNADTGMLAKAADLPGEFTQEQAFAACFPSIDGVKYEDVRVVGPMTKEEEVECDLSCIGGFVPILEGEKMETTSVKNWTPGGGI